MRTFLTLLIITCGALQAQQQESKRTCRILFLERPKDAPVTLYLHDGKDSQKVDLPKMNLSPVYELPSGEITLRLLPNPPDNAETIPAGAPSLVIREAMTDLYLLVLSDPENKVAPVRMQAVNAATKRFGKGQTAWYNLTGLLIGGKLGEEKIMIQPGGNAVSNAPRKDAGDYHVAMAYRKSDSEVSYPIFETRWVHDPQSRNIGFVIPAKAARTPRVIVFPDVRPEPQPTE